MVAWRCRPTWDSPLLAMQDVIVVALEGSTVPYLRIPCDKETTQSYLHQYPMYLLHHNVQIQRYCQGDSLKVPWNDYNYLTENNCFQPNSPIRLKPAATLTCWYRLVCVCLGGGGFFNLKMRRHCYLFWLAC